MNRIEQAIADGWLDAEGNSVAADAMAEDIRSSNIPKEIQNVKPGPSLDEMEKTVRVAEGVQVYDTEEEALESVSDTDSFYVGDRFYCSKASIGVNPHDMDRFNKIAKNKGWL